MDSKILKKKKDDTRKDQPSKITQTKDTLSNKKPFSSDSVGDLSEYAVIASGSAKREEIPITSTSDDLKSPVVKLKPTEAECTCPDGPLDPTDQHTYIKCSYFINCYACLQFFLEGKAHRAHGEPQAHKRKCNSKQRGRGGRGKRRKRESPAKNTPRLEPKNPKNAPQNEPSTPIRLRSPIRGPQLQTISSPLQKPTVLLSSNQNLDLLGSPIPGDLFEFPGSPITSGDYRLGNYMDPSMDASPSLLDPHRRTSFDGYL